MKKANTEMNTAQIAAEAAKELLNIAAYAPYSIKELARTTAIIKSACEKATEQIQVVLEAERRHNESTIVELESRAAHASEDADTTCSHPDTMVGCPVCGEWLRPAHASEQGADTELIREIAQESAIERRHGLNKYVVVQITTSTWDKLQARYHALSQRPTHSSAEATERKPGTAPTGNDFLMPCPFCGSENITVEPLVGGFVVDCQDCGAGCGTCHSEQAAHIEWNKRKPLREILKERGIDSDKATAQIEATVAAPTGNAETQEKWTPRTLLDILNAISMDDKVDLGKGLQAIADAHNAALKLAWDKGHEVASAGAAVAIRNAQSDDTKRLEWVLAHGGWMNWDKDWNRADIDTAAAAMSREGKDAHAQP